MQWEVRTRWRGLALETSPLEETDTELGLVASPRLREEGEGGQREGRNGSGGPRRSV